MMLCKVFDELYAQAVRGGIVLGQFSSFVGYFGYEIDNKLVVMYLVGS